MNKFDVNLNILKKSSAILYKQVTKDKPINNVKLMKLESFLGYSIGYDDKVVNMHSVYDIDFEMKKMFEMLDGMEETVILFGLGEGHALKYIKDRFKNVEKIVVIEPSLNIFKEFLKNNNLVESVQGISVSFLVNRSSEFVGTEVGMYMKDNKTKLVHHVSYRIVFEKYYSEILLGMKNSIIIRHGNSSFRRTSMKNLIFNFLLNMKHGYIDGFKLEKALQGKPLLVVAAGPSLNKNMHLINKLKNKAIVVAVGSAIKILDSNNIVPHFRMAFDPFQIEMKVVKDLNNENVPIVYSNNLYYDVLETYIGPKINVDIASDYGKTYLNYKNKTKRKIVQTGTSIAISAVDMGVKYGSSKIIIIGFDAAYSSDKLYADGVGESRSNEIKEKLKRPGSYESIDIFGNKVLTNKGFYMNKMGLEIVTNANPNMKFIDATEGGLPINGTEIKPLQDVIDENLQDTYDEIIDEKFEVSQDIIEKYQDENKELLKNMLAEIEEIEEVNRKRIKKTKKLYKYNNNSIKTEYILREVKLMQNYIADLNEIDLYKYYIAPNLSSVFSAIVGLTRYNGFDKIKKCSNGIEKYLKISAELNEFCTFLKECIELELNNELYNTIKKGTLA